MLVRSNAPSGRWGIFATLALALLLVGAVVPLTLWRYFSLGSPFAIKPAPDFGKLPLSFEANAGQTDPSARFIVRASGGTLYFTPSEVVMSLGGKATTHKGIRDATGLGQQMNPASAEQEAASVVRLSFIGVNPETRISSGTPLPGKVNYFLGNDPAQWHTDLPTYGSIVYNSLYPGVDLSYSGDSAQLKGTYILAAGADPGRIQWRYANANGVSLDAAGNLQVSVAGTANSAAGTITEQAPVAWQDINGKRVDVSARYLVSEDGKVGLALGAYDKAHSLSIDPVLTYSSYLGGSGADTSYGVALDPSGNIYLTGQTASANFPLSNAYQPTLHGSTDGFVTKLNPSGSALVYSTYLGGSSSDYGIRLVADASGNAYVVGATTSANFPTQNAIQPTFGGGTYDAFVTKLNSSGSALVYSTYLGGNDADYGDDITIDSTGNAYVSGEAASANFPTQNALQPSRRGLIDIFVSKINPAGSAFVYSTFFGGGAFDEGFAIAVDTAGNAYLTGATTSFDFPTLNPIQPNYGGGQYDSFLTKINAAGSAVVYSTYLGGNNIDAGWGLSVDGSGNAYLDGYTNSTNYPTQNAFQPTNHGGFDMFISKLNAGGSALVYSTYLGGGNDDLATTRVVGLAIDGQGAAYVAGATFSTDFPVANPIQPANAGGSDAIAAKLNSAGSALIYSTYLGGSGNDFGFDVVTDGTGNAYVTGNTVSSNFPTVNAYQPASGGGGDAFIARIADQPSIATPTNTPSISTPTNTPSISTPSNTPAVSTPTNTPSISTPTVTPVKGCRFSILDFDACFNGNSCNCVDYSIPFQNQDDTAVVITGTVVLKARGGTVIGHGTIPAVYIGANGRTVVDGTICPSSAGSGPYHVEVTIRAPGRTCEEKHKTQPVRGTCGMISSKR